MSTNQPITRRMILAGGAALVIGGAAVHVAAAQQAATPTDSRDVIFFSTGGATDPAKHREVWTKALADKLGVSLDRLQQAIQDTSKEVGLPPPVLGASGAFSLKIESPFATAAKALGITEAQLQKEQAAGKSLNQIARDHGVDPKVIGDAVSAQRRADVDKAVSDGSLPKDVADRIKSHIDDEVEHILQVVPNGLNDVFTLEVR
jgi:hypothetical protein